MFDIVKDITNNYNTTFNYYKINRKDYYFIYIDNETTIVKIISKYANNSKNVILEKRYLQHEYQPTKKYLGILIYKKS